MLHFHGFDFALPGLVPRGAEPKPQSYELFIMQPLLPFEFDPAIGIVIGTYGATPFVHLHLALAKRLYPQVPILVHDDASPEEDELRALCAGYGAEFRTSRTRGGHAAGDLRCYARGLEWARERDLDLLVKFSRRFVPLYDWTMELKRLARSFPYPTFCSYNTSYRFGFRTECVAFAVEGWTARCGQEPSALDQIVAHENRGVGLVELFMHDLARATLRRFLRGEIAVALLDRNALDGVESMERKFHEIEAYAQWPIGGSSREAATWGVLWHTHDDPQRQPAPRCSGALRRTGGRAGVALRTGGFRPLSHPAKLTLALPSEISNYTQFKGELIMSVGRHPDVNGNLILTVPGHGSGGANFADARHDGDYGGLYQPPGAPGLLYSAQAHEGALSSLVTLPSVGLDVDVTFYYNSRSQANGSCGYRRFCSLDLSARASGTPIEGGPFGGALAGCHVHARQRRSRGLRL